MWCYDLKKPRNHRTIQLTVPPHPPTIPKKVQTNPNPNIADLLLQLDPLNCHNLLSHFMLRFVDNTIGALTSKFEPNEFIVDLTAALHHGCYCYSKCWSALAAITPLNAEEIFVLAGKKLNKYWSDNAAPFLFTRGWGLAARQQRMLVCIWRWRCYTAWSVNRYTGWNFV